MTAGASAPSGVTRMPAETAMVLPLLVAVALTWWFRRDDDSRFSRALALAPEHDRHSVALMQVLNRWIESIGPADRRALTDDLFDSLSAGGAVTLGDVADGGSGGFEAVLVRMFHARPETKKIMMELPAQFVAALRERLRPTDREETL